jgi:Methyltransferase domain
VADAGGGNGFDRRQIVPQGRCQHAIGAGLSAGVLRAREDLRRPGRLSLVQADAQRLPLPGGSADAAVARHMLYHAPGPASPTDGRTAPGAGLPGLEPRRGTPGRPRAGPAETSPVTDHRRGPRSSAVVSVTPVVV